MMTSPSPKLALGIMSGTSVDGIDLALIETDGLQRIRSFDNAVFPINPSLQAEILRAIAENISEETQLSALRDQLTEAYYEAILAFLQPLSMKPDIIGLHGQTIMHNPKAQKSLQLSDGRVLAERLGIDVVDQFRLADIQAGGEGAPLAPVYHQALARDIDGPVIFVNLGGVANVSYIDGEQIWAMDTGPASALIDDYMKANFHRPYDAGGAYAEKGQADFALINEFLTMPYFDRPPPKSLDRQHFHAVLDAVNRMENPYDAVATLSEFTVSTLLLAQTYCPRPPRRWIIMGGGRHNHYLLQRLKENIPAQIHLAEDFGWNGDAIEAELMGFLAVRCLYDLPISFPSTTHAPYPLKGGQIHRAK